MAKSWSGWFKTNKNEIISGLLFSFGVFMLIYFVILPLIPEAPDNRGNLPFISVEPGKSGDCTDCEFLIGLKDYSNIKCNPTSEQLKSISRLDDAEIFECSTKICSSTVPIITSCFSGIVDECSSCNFKSLFGQECMVQAYKPIVETSDNIEFQQKYQIAGNCGCIPTTEQIQLFNGQINNSDVDWLKACETAKFVEDKCYTETQNLIESCKRESLPKICDPCEFVISASTNCIGNFIEIMNDYDKLPAEEKDVIRLEPLIQYAHSCNCTPTQEQIDIAENIRSNGTDPLSCTTIPFCSEMESYITANNCVDENATLAPVSPPVLETVPPDINLPATCSNCEFITKIKSGCVQDGLDAFNPGSEVTDFIKVYVGGLCGCTPTDDQKLSLINILNNDTNLSDCSEDVNCTELKSIHTACNST